MPFTQGLKSIQKVDFIPLFKKDDFVNELDLNKIPYHFIFW